MASVGKEEIDLLLAQATHLKNVLWYFLTELEARSCKISPGRVRLTPSILYQVAS